MTAAPGDRWYCGPATDRWAYAVDDITGIQGGEGHVVRAERRSRGDDPVGYEGPASLKLATDHRPERVARLQERWARLTGVQHPNLARALEVFEGPGLFRTTCPPRTDDVLYVAAAWVEGQPLRSAGRFDAAGAAALARDLAAGLTALHGHGMVHRDVHPGNVVLDEDGRAVLIDFGCCRGEDAAATGTVTGTLGFIPPEELHGRVDAAADRWGLGMVTVFALLGHPQGPQDRATLVAELEVALAAGGDPRRAARLLADMVDPEPHRRPTDAVRWADELTAAVAGTLRSRPRRVLAVAAAATVVLAGTAAGLALAAAPDHPDDPGGGSAGRAGPETSPDCAPAGRDGTPALADAVERLAPGSCAGGEPQMFVDAEFQALADDEGRNEGVILVAPSGEAVRLNDAMWTSYREIAGKVSPENAVTYGGYPVAVERTDDPEAVVVRLDRGGYMVGHREDTQLFWLPTPVLDLYESHGGLDGDLGFPMTNPHTVGDDLRLDFENGYMEAPFDQMPALLQGEPVETAVVVPDADADADPDAASARERIVRQATGTAWWVDGDGTRHWIPDGGTWECLGGDAVVVESNARGWDVAEYPLGDPAVCP